MLSVAKRSVRTALASVGLGIRRISPAPTPPTPYPVAADDRSLMERFAPYTMTSPERQYALLRAVRYIDAANIPGDIVECGVWRGGSMMIAKAASARPRRFHLFDTFTGMTPPTDADVEHTGQAASVRLDDPWFVCEASIEDVRRNLDTFGFLNDSTRLIKGPVEETLRDPANLPDHIALLRLDTDWYESTKVELETLYPRLASGGVLIIDDYGHWRGARQATDEYFSDRPILLSHVDYTGVVGIKR